MIYAPGFGWIDENKIDDPALQMDIGFITPEGNLEICKYGEHEQLAMEICIKNNWVDLYTNSEHILCSDFLILEKGYILVNRPGHSPTLTLGKIPNKKQEDIVIIYTSSGFEERYINY